MNSLIDGLIIVPEILPKSFMNKMKLVNCTLWKQSIGADNLWIYKVWIIENSWSCSVSFMNHEAFTYKFFNILASG